MRLLLALCLALFILCCAAGVARADLSGSSTAYHRCDGSTGITASGSGVYFGEVASNSIRLGSWIEMVHPRRVHGRRFFRVLDTGGPGFLIDFYAPSCGWMNWWGRRTITVRVLRSQELWHGLPRRGYHWRCCWAKPHFSYTR